MNLRWFFRLGAHVRCPDPWTLSSDLAWDKTHRLIGRPWVVGGTAMFLVSQLGRTDLQVGVILLFALGSLSVAFVYSYLVWKSDPDKRTIGGDDA